LEGIGITQGDKFISANKTLLTIFGFENLDEFIGKSILDYATPESRDIITERLIKRAYGEELSPRYEIQIIRKDGEKRYLEISAGTLLIGEEMYIQSTFRDITLKKTADDELKHSREQLRNLATHLEKARETERKEIAYEIHDDLGQCLTAMKMDISWIGKKLEKSQKTLYERAKSMSELIDDTINKVRMISTQLRPSILDHFGIAAAIEWIGEDFQKRTDISCKITIAPKDIELDEFTSTGVFRICQEALTNIARHAQATTVDISLIKNNGILELKVVDDGIGIDEESVNDVHSFGLIGIRERAYLAGGSSSIVGKPNEGTTITVQIPIINNGEQDD
jgi:PAS domain S-box-containing protein